MAVTFTVSQLQDMLRNNGISGSFGFTISTTGNQVEAKKVGFLHSVKAFFGFGNARAENTATLNAIRDAIMNVSLC